MSDFLKHCANSISGVTLCVTCGYLMIKMGPVVPHVAVVVAVVSLRVSPTAAAAGLQPEAPTPTPGSREGGEVRKESEMN